MTSIFRDLYNGPRIYVWSKYFIGFYTLEGLDKITTIFWQKEGGSVFLQRPEEAISSSIYDLVTISYHRSKKIFPVQYNNKKFVLF